METLKRLKLVFLLIVLNFALLNAQSFVHPGVLHTQQDFDRMAQKVNSNEQPWKGSYDSIHPTKYIFSLT